VGGAATEIPAKFKSAGGLFPEPDGVTSMKRTNCECFLSERRKEWPAKARSVLCNFGLLSFEPCPNPAWTRPSPVLGPCRPLVAAGGRMTHEAVCPLRKQLWLDGCVGVEPSKVGLALIDDFCSWGGGGLF
jgi:hypothetical protein